MEIEHEKKLLTVRLDGELDHHRAPELRDAIDRELSRSGATDIAFDLAALTFMDSSGIGLIMGRYKKIRLLGGKIVIFGQSREVDKILRMSGIDKIAEVF